LLGIAYRLGLRHIVGFMVLASLAAIPLEKYTSIPINAWHPNEEELDHGFYWVTFFPCVILASATGLAFWWGISRKLKPMQLPDPKSPCVTPPAGAGGAPSVTAD
jgi:hypothetical protein